MTDDASPENLRKFLESDDPSLVMMGISLAKGAGVEVTIKDLERFLKSEDVETVKTGIMLAKEAGIDVELTIEDLKHFLKCEGVEAIRAGIMLADEAGIGDEAMEMLCEPLGDYDNDDVESYRYIFKDTAGWLGEIGDARAVEPLIEALGDYDNWSMMEDTINGEDARGAIAWALGEIGDQRAVEPLIEALFYGDGEYCVDFGRVAAAEALGEIGDARAVEPLIELWKFTGEWSSPSSWEHTRWKATRDAIHRTLEKIGKPAVALLIQMLRDDEVQAVRPEWYENHASDDYVNGDAEALIRCFAAEALGNIGDTQAVEPLIEALEDEKDTDEFRAAWGMGTRSSAAEALGKIGDVRAVEPLIKALSDDDEWVIDASKESLRKLGHEVE
jgi:HEAT repeat protein